MSGNSLSFGPFELLPDQKKLLRDGEAVSIGSRAFEILALLVDQAGRLVGNREIMARVWPNTIVEEANLRVNMTALRRALGENRGEENYIKNTPGRGYTFVTPLNHRDALAAPISLERARLPVPLSRLIGRTASITAIREKLSEQRLLTIVGPGGIGKTSVAIAAGNEIADQYEHGAIFVDLAPLIGSGLVASALATTCGLPVVSTDATPVLQRFFRDRNTLIIFDNCDHVIEETAGLIESLLRTAPGLHILATSREPLHSQGEWIYRLDPLSIPSRDTGDLTLQGAAAFAAPELFLERTRATLTGFDLEEGDIPKLIELCRKLDGIPLAIELAAARINQFGLTGLLAHIGDQLALLTKGRRTALPHHKTLRATLDWSYDVLPDLEKSIFRRLAVFKGYFTIEAATAIVSTEDVNEDAVADAIASLAEKSLLTVDLSQAVPRHRLLETTRAYAADKLKADDNGPDVYARHARYLCQQIERMENAYKGWERRQAYLDHIDDIRSALEWAFSREGDAKIAIVLTKLSSALWFHLSLLQENRERLEKALAVLAELPSPDPLDEIALNVGYGHALWHTSGRAELMVRPFETALAAAERTGDPTKIFLPLWGMWAFENLVGRHPASLHLAKRFGTFARRTNDRDALRIHERMMARSLHYTGDHSAAEEYCDRVLTYERTANPAARTTPFQFDQRSAALAIVARVQWIKGFPDLAADTTQKCVEGALKSGHTLTLCYALGSAGCLIPAWRGETDLALKNASLLYDRSSEHSLTYWLWWGRCYPAFLREPFEASEGSLAARVPDATITPLHLEVAATLRPALLEESVFVLAEEGSLGWCAPEVIRARGEMLLNREHTAQAEALFKEALELARQQGALSWQLRTATSLARLWIKGGRDNDALILLDNVYRQFSEGYSTTDLRTAAALLDSLRAN